MKRNSKINSTPKCAPQHVFGPCALNRRDATPSFRDAYSWAGMCVASRRWQEIVDIAGIKYLFGRRVLPFSKSQSGSFSGRNVHLTRSALQVCVFDSAATECAERPVFLLPRGRLLINCPRATVTVWGADGLVEGSGTITHSIAPKHTPNQHSFRATFKVGRGSRKQIVCDHIERKKLQNIFCRNEPF